MPKRDLAHISEGRLRSSDCPQNRDQHYGSHKGSDDRADQASGADSNQTEKPATEKSADHADDHVADDAVASAAHHLSCEPTRNQADQKKPDQSCACHGSAWLQAARPLNVACGVELR